MGRDVQRGLGQEGAVRDDGAAVGAQLLQRLLELRVARVLGLEQRDAELLGALRHGAGDQLAAAAGGRVGAGDDADQLVAGLGDGVQGGDGDLGGAGEHDAHD